MAQTLLNRTERTLARTGLPVLRSDEASQRGITFGERLANAVSDAFDRGYARVIVVGNDCASLRTSHLRAAARMLASGQQVLGPDRRGGAWLIGLQRNGFQKTDFANLRWESAEVYAGLAELLPGIACLTSLHDVNSLGDLRRLWTFLRSRLAELFDVVFSPEITRGEPVFARLLLSASPQTNRGPPCVNSGL